MEHAARDGADGGPTAATRPGYKGGYFPVAPADHYADLRDQMVTNLSNAGLRPSSAATTRSARPARPRSTTSSPRCCGSGDQTAAVQVHHQEHRLGRRQDARRSCPSRCSVTTAPACTPTRASGTDGEPLFYDETGYGGLSDMARWYIGGLLHHAPSLLAFTNPTVNSLPPPGAGLRGAGQPGLLAAQPLGLHPHPGHRHQRRRPSASSSACPTRRPTRTWPSRRC